MSGWLLAHEPALRLAAFVGVFLGMVIWERIASRRALTVSRTRRWLFNLGLVVVNTAALRLLIPTAAVGAAALAEAGGWGLLNQIALPPALSALAAMLMLDLGIYLQHVLFHAVPALWRLHRLHHADRDLDATTGLRFHPLEILISMGIKLAMVALIGPPVVAVLLFEVLLNAGSLFNHGNVRIPESVDRALRLVVVTPDMHRVHHSILREEQNSNYGFNLAWWDRLLGTYRAQPAGGHLGMTIGVAEPA